MTADCQGALLCHTKRTNIAKVVRKQKLIESKQFLVNVHILTVGSLSSATRTGVKTSLKNEFASFQFLLRLFGPAQFDKCNRRFFLELNYQNYIFELLFRFKKRKENSSSYVPVLHKTSHKEVSRRSRAVDVKEMY